MGGQRARGATAMIAAGAAARASPAQKFLVGLIGEGIQGSRSPALHEHEARHLGLALHYQLIDLARDGRSASDLPASISRIRASRPCYRCSTAFRPTPRRLARSIPSFSGTASASATIPIGPASPRHFYEP